MKAPGIPAGAGQETSRHASHTTAALAAATLQEVGGCFPPVAPPARPWGRCRMATALGSLPPLRQRSAFLRISARGDSKPLSSVSVFQKQEVPVPTFQRALAPLRAKLSLELDMPGIPFSKGLFFSCPMAKRLPGARLLYACPLLTSPQLGTGWAPSFLLLYQQVELQLEQSPRCAKHSNRIPAKTAQTLQSCRLPTGSSFSAPLEPDELNPP